MRKISVILFEEGTNETIEIRHFDVPPSGGEEAQMKVEAALLAVAAPRLKHEAERWKGALRATRRRFVELYDATRTLQEFVRGKESLAPQERMTLKDMLGLVNVLATMDLGPAATVLRELEMYKDLENNERYTVNQLLGDWFYDVYRIRIPSD